jgi:hypothetical protein
MGKRGGHCLGNLALQIDRDTDRLAERILKLDSSIMGVGILDHNGIPLVISISEKYKSRLPSKKEEWASESFRVATALASVKASDRKLSATEAIIIIRRDCKVLVTWIQEMRIIVVVMFERATIGGEMSEKIRRMLGAA